MPIQEFVDLISEHAKDGMVVCEVGCYDGETTLGYLPIVRQNNGRVILVDWFRGNVDAGEGPHGYNEANAPNVRLQLENKIKDYLDIVEIIEGKSQEVFERIDDGILDICFLDASHKYKDFILDIKNFYPKVKNNGILCGHDFENGFTKGSFTDEELAMDWCSQKKCHPGVVQGVYDFFGDDFHVKCYAGNIHGTWWVTK